MTADTVDADAAVYAHLWKHFLLPPLSSDIITARRMQRARVLVTLLSFVDAFIAPMIIAFDLGDAAVICVLAIGWSIDILAWLDILVTFRTTLVSVDDELITDSAVIARRYLHSTLPLDVVVSLPLELLGPVAYGLASPAVRACRLLRVPRPLRRLHTHHASRLLRLSRPARLALCWCLWLLLAHWCGCAWWALGTAESRLFDPQMLPPGVPVRTPWVRRTQANGAGTPLWPRTSAAQAYWSSLCARAPHLLLTAATFPAAHAARIVFPGRGRT